MMLHVLAVIFTIFAGAVGSNFESCPSGLKTLEMKSTTTCYFFPNGDYYDRYKNSIQDAHSACLEKNSSLIAINSEEKLNRFRHFANPGTLWAGLYTNDSKLYMMTKDGPVQVKDIPFDLNLEQYKNSNFVFIDGHLSTNEYVARARYVCEQHPGCKTGLFGRDCDRECHCYDEECDSKAQELTCTFGCDVGWMGDDCSQKKEDAVVRYSCVQSEDQGKYAQVVVETKGVHYDHIEAVDEQGDWIPWCETTVVRHTDNNPSFTVLKIFIDDSSNEDLNSGKCAGQITDTGKYEWLLKIQEHDGVVSRNDQEISIECDFEKGDKLFLSDETKVNRESLFNKTDLKRPMKYLKEKKEKVKLELVDPSKNEPVSEVHLGSPVALRITFGLKKSNFATGVHPYNCEASSPEGEHKVKFLDQNGCPVSGFPISAFYKSGPKSLMTKSFPLFGFDDTKEVEFHCDYSFCFGFENCQKECGLKVSEAGRSRRSTGERKMSVMNKVEILEP